MSYFIINKNDGSLRQPFILYDDMSMPINGEELQYIDAPQELIDHFDNFNGQFIVDLDNTKFVNNNLNLVFKEVPRVTNYAEIRYAEINKRIQMANRLLLISDLPENYIAKLNKWKIDLESIEITNNEIQAIIWPEKP